MSRLYSRVTIVGRIGLAVALFVWAPFAPAQDPTYVLRAASVEDSVGSSTTVPFSMDFPLGAGLSGWSYAVCHDSSLVSLAGVSDGLATLGVLDGAGPDFNSISEYPNGWTVGVVVSFIGADSLAPGSDYELNRATYQLDAVGEATLDFCGQSLGTPPVDIIITTVGFQTIQPVTENGSISIGMTPNFSIRAEEVVGAPGEMVEVAVELVNLLPIEGFSFGLSHDRSIATLAGIEIGASLVALHGGDGPDFVSTNLNPDGGIGGTVGVLFSRTAPFEQLQPTDAAAPHELVVMTYAISALSQDGTAGELAFTSELGSPPIAAIACLDGVSRSPSFQPGLLTVDGDPLPPMGGFVRADVNQDGVIDIADGIFLFSYLFAGGPAPRCDDAADGNDDGEVSIADGVYVISFITSGGPAPTPPSGMCAIDPTDDPLGCAEFTACP